MGCNRPLPAWRRKDPKEKGPTFRFAEADTSQPLHVPCGRCMGCRLEKAREWAVRMVHESKLHKHNFFVTLTYDEEQLPRTDSGLPTLKPEDFVLFMKRLRKKKGNGVRYYQCGEYGETTFRPHHHAIIFNCTFPDLQPLRLTRARDAHTLYRSAELEKLWGKGIVSVGSVNFETAAYVASYVTKKFTAKTSDEVAAYYQGRTPEYATMSRRPGIGRGFLDKYDTDIYPESQVIVRGRAIRPPKYYDRIKEGRDPEDYELIRFMRETKSLGVNRTPQQREAKEQETIARIRKRDAQ